MLKVPVSSGSQRTIRTPLAFYTGPEGIADLIRNIIHMQYFLMIKDMQWHVMKAYLNTEQGEMLFTYGEPIILYLYL